jgi:hypothetical protein
MTLYGLCHFALDDEERYYEQWFEKLLCDTTHQDGAPSLFLGHFFPRSGLSVTFQVIYKDGSLLACAVNALSLALLHAGLPLRSTVFAFHYVARFDDDKKRDTVRLICNPNEEQERRVIFDVTLVTENTSVHRDEILALQFLSRSHHASNGHASGPLGDVAEACLADCLNLSKKHAGDILGHFRSILS